MKIIHYNNFVQPFFFITDAVFVTRRVHLLLYFFSSWLPSIIGWMLKAVSMSVLLPFLLVVMISEVVCFNVPNWWSVLVTLVCTNETFHICWEQKRSYINFMLCVLLNCRELHSAPSHAHFLVMCCLPSLVYFTVCNCALFERVWSLTLNAVLYTALGTASFVCLNMELF